LLTKNLIKLYGRPIAKMKNFSRIDKKGTPPRFFLDYLDPGLPRDFECSQKNEEDKEKKAFLLQEMYGEILKRFCEESGRILCLLDLRRY